MEFVQTSHCSWDRGDQRIVQQYCPAENGVVFRLFDGRTVTPYRTLEAAKQAAGDV